MTDPQFRPGDTVRRRSSPDIVGIVRGSDSDEQLGEIRYRVQFGNSLKGVPESDLEPLPDNADPWLDAKAGRFAMARAFRARLTYERLRKPPSRIAESFGSARAAFYPYQFKPLLKFLENQRQRLLIADDVGLGKTIEAGYILREMRARHGIDRTLIIVPARLQPKWKNELERRFDENFELVRTRELIRLRHSLERDQEPEPFRWITSYEAARDDRFVSLLEEFEPAIDLVIVDEAHRMRNTSTAQHALGRALAACADAMIFLTATPVQTGLENLFNLLRLLSPDEFSDYFTFQMQTTANRPIVRLVNAIRDPSATTRQTEPLIAEIRSNPLTSALTDGDYFASIVERASRIGTLDRSTRIDLQRDIAELTLTSHIVNRTRKVEVLPDRPQRRANSQSVVLGQAEMSFYSSVADLCRDLRPDLSEWALSMTTLMAYRYTASCIPAAMELFRERAARRDLANVFAQQTEDTDAAESEDADVEKLSQSLGVIAERVDLGQTDSKFDAFSQAIRDIWQDDAAAGRPPRKVVVFSYFKRTLRYLSDRLSRLGIDHRRIDGDMAIPDREIYIDEFASDAAVRVLLSSEVGAEGLDLQFASVIVNYDLPWNPMVVEQRIGRIDRIGQSSPIVTIVNLVAEGTVEERILLRLYERIGIFQETIGEIDPILGDTIEKLTIEALTGSLSEEEQRRRVEQTADAFLKQEHEAARLGSDADALMAADQAFLDEVDALVGKRQVPQPSELYELVSDYLSKYHTGSKFPRTVIIDSVDVRLPPTVAHEMRNLVEVDSDVVRLSRKIEGGAFAATLNQQAALGHARAELIHARHPMVRLAYETAARAGNNARAFSMTVDLGADRLAAIDSGVYAFSIWLFDLQGIRARTEIVPLLVRLGSNEPLSSAVAEAIYIQMLDASSDFVAADVDPVRLESARALLTNTAKGMRQALYSRESALDAARQLRRKATLQATLRSRLNKAQARLEDLKRKAAAEFAIRMAEVKLKHAQTQYDSAAAEASAIRRFGIEDEEIAVGVVALRVARDTA